LPRNLLYVLQVEGADFAPLVLGFYYEIPAEGSERTDGAC